MRLPFALLRTNHKWRPDIARLAWSVTKCTIIKQVLMYSVQYHTLLYTILYCNSTSYLACIWGSRHWSTTNIHLFEPGTTAKQKTTSSSSCDTCICGTALTFHQFDLCLHHPRCIQEDESPRVGTGSLLKHILHYKLPRELWVAFVLYSSPTEVVSKGQYRPLWGDGGIHEHTVLMYTSRHTNKIKTKDTYKNIPINKSACKAQNISKIHT